LEGSKIPSHGSLTKAGKTRDRQKKDSQKEWRTDKEGKKLKHNKKSKSPKINKRRLYEKSLREKKEK